MRSIGKFVINKPFYELFLSLLPAILPQTPIPYWWLYKHWEIEISIYQAILLHCLKQINSITCPFNRTVTKHNIFIHMLLKHWRSTKSIQLFSVAAVVVIPVANGFYAFVSSNRLYVYNRAKARKIKNIVQMNKLCYYVQMEAEKTNTRITHSSNTHTLDEENADARISIIKVSTHRRTYTPKTILKGNQMYVCVKT